MKKYKFALSFLIFAFVELKGQQIFFQGFEPGDTWGILEGASKISNDNGASYFPANQTIRSGSNFWKVNNPTTGADTLLLESKSISGYNNVKVIVRLSSISVTSNNGSENTDSVQVFAILDGNMPNKADIIVTGALNSRWGYDATLIASTTAGSSQTFVSPQNGYSTNNYATLEISIPNGTNTVGLMIRAKNNSVNEIWAIDDIEMVACPSVTLSGPFSGCLADTLTYTSSANGDWSVSNGNASIVSNASNTNTVQIVLTNGSSTSIIQNVSGCQFVQNINIYPNPIPPMVGPVSPICQGNSAVLTANSPNYTILWFESLTGSPIGTGNVFTTPPITQAGTVTFYAAAENNYGCISSKVPVSVTVNPTPTRFNIGGEVVCLPNDGHITLDSSQTDISYELYIDGNPTGQIIIGNNKAINFIISSPVNGSMVTIQATDPNTGCSIFMDTLTLNLVNGPNNFYTFNVDTLEICEGSPANFSLSGSQFGVIYQVYVNGNDISVAQFGNGNVLNFSVGGNILFDGDIIHIIAVDTSTGCEVDLTDQLYIHVKIKPEITISENSGIFTADSTTGIFVWYHNGNIIPGQNQPTLDVSQTGTGSGNYYLVYTNSLGCTDTSNTINLIISKIQKNWQEQIVCYPNPFQNFVLIQSPVSMNLTVRNVLGQILHTQRLEIGTNSIDFSELPSGVYIFEFKYFDNQWITKLVKP